MTVDEFNQAVDQYADGVYRFVLKNLRDTEKARDVVQDSFEKLWLNYDRIDAPKAKAYLFSIAYHRLIDVVRKDQKILVVDETHLREDTHSEQYSDIGEILERAVKQLPETQRLVLMLRDYEGYSYKEIADIAGLSENQVKVYIYRARVFLKEYIGNMEVLI